MYSTQFGSTEESKWACPLGNGSNIRYGQNESEDCSTRLSLQSCPCFPQHFPLTPYPFRARRAALWSTRARRPANNRSTIAVGPGMPCTGVCADLHIGSVLPSACLLASHRGPPRYHMPQRQVGLQRGPMYHRLVPTLCPQLIASVPISVLFAEPKDILNNELTIVAGLSPSNSSINNMSAAERTLRPHSQARHVGTPPLPAPQAEYWS